MKLTEGELSKARSQAKKIKDDDAAQIADLQNQTNAQLATKASTDDVNKLGTDVNGVKTDLDATKNNLQMARGEFGTLIARNHDEVEELRRLGERDYYEFNIEKKNAREKVGNLMVELHGTNTKKSQYAVTIFVDDQRHEKKNMTANEPLYSLRERRPRAARVRGEPGWQRQDHRLLERAESEPGSCCRLYPAAIKLDRELVASRTNAKSKRGVLRTPLFLCLFRSRSPTK